MKKIKRLFLIIILAGFVSTGCQTFSLNRDDFEKQQRGGTADVKPGDEQALKSLGEWMQLLNAFAPK